ncbi:unnamed protein product [Timema podura]|uniref:Uncharacterized protein n=1 Tax=Timema podura TaxID=61482 RepID=A0ABN7P2W2_TIMPD|nr:unnamed protein product [Timema podura]
MVYVINFVTNPVGWKIHGKTFKICFTWKVHHNHFLGWDCFEGQSFLNTYILSHSTSQRCIEIIVIKQ